MTNHKSRIWRDIDKHPLPTNGDLIDVKLDCGSILNNCTKLVFAIEFRGRFFSFESITQWRNAK